MLKDQLEEAKIMRKALEQAAGAKAVRAWHLQGRDYGLTELGLGFGA